MRPEPGSAAEAEDDVKRLPVAPGGAAAGLSWRLLLRHRWPLIGSIATFSLAALAGVVPPLALGRIVDIVDTGGRRSELIGPVAAIAVSAAVALLATSLSVALLARAAEPALADLREQVLERAVHLDSEEIDEVGEGARVVVMRNGEIRSDGAVPDLLARAGGAGTVAEAFARLTTVPEPAA